MEFSGIVFYDDMRQAKPASRWKDFNKYLMYAADLGSDMQSVQNHFARVFEYLNYEDIENSRKELTNLYFNIYNILEGISGDSIALAAMVKSVNGVEANDLSEDGLKQTAKKIESLLSQEEIEEIKNKIKKKYLSN